MRLRGIAVLVALIVGLLQVGPAVACALSCGANCPMHARQQTCCDDEPATQDCKCVFAAPEMRTSDQATLTSPAPTIEIATPFFSILIVEIDVRDSLVRWEDKSPPGVFQASCKHERAPPIA